MRCFLRVEPKILVHTRQRPATLKAIGYTGLQRPAYEELTCNGQTLSRTLIASATGRGCQVRISDPEKGSRSKATTDPTLHSVPGPGMRSWLPVALLPWSGRTAQEAATVMRRSLLPLHDAPGPFLTSVPSSPAAAQRVRRPAIRRGCEGEERVPSHCAGIFGRSLRLAR